MKIVAAAILSSIFSAFQKFKNVDRDEHHTDMSTLASPASQNSPDVYILPLTEVSLPVAKQPSRPGESHQLQTNPSQPKPTHPAPKGGHMAASVETSRQVPEASLIYLHPTTTTTTQPQFLSRDAMSALRSNRRQNLCLTMVTTAPIPILACCGTF